MWHGSKGSYNLAFPAPASGSAGADMQPPSAAVAPPHHEALPMATKQGWMNKMTAVALAVHEGNQPRHN